MENIILALLFPFAGTTLGAAFVFFMKKEIPNWLLKSLLGFASGVMVAASVWSLLIPAMEMAGVGAEGASAMEVGTAATSAIATSAMEARTAASVSAAEASVSGAEVSATEASAAEASVSGMATMGMAVVVLGLFAGFALLFFIDAVTPHLHPLGEEEGPKSKLSQTSKLALAVTIHNFPEGMAVGVSLAAALAHGEVLTLASALALSVGIAIQNIPEGAIVSMPLRAAGNSRLKSFVIGSLSGIVEPIGAIVVILLAAWLAPLTPFMLALSAGAMLYVVIEELIPEASQGTHSNIATLGFAIGFALMMVLDVVLG